MGYAQEELEKAASSVGMQVLIQGELPESEKIQRVFLRCGLECLLNAHQHASATEMRIVILRSKQRHTVTFRFSNDGDRPSGHIQPIGGLQMIRAAVEEARGAWSLSDHPDFLLEIELPLP